MVKIIEQYTGNEITIKERSTKGKTMMNKGKM